MKVGVGYSDNPETTIAGRHAVDRAIRQAGRNDPCDIALLFSTARHNQQVLRDAVASAIGTGTPIYGGGAVGVITNEYFGYAGDQIGIACIWLDGVRCDVLIEGGLERSEEETGVRLGQRLSALGSIESHSPVMLFYDALDCTGGENGMPAVRMLMATWLLEGIKKGLGFFPDLTGAGLIGDHSWSPTSQWIGNTLGDHNAIALSFSGDIRIDSVVMHGCRPATQYYTVTKADKQVILEINGKPAITFISELLGPSISPEQFPFYLIFGVNHGDKWGEYNEDYYASRLCLGIDRERGGIVMFEPDMVEGTEFQLMFQAIDLDYIKPKIDKVFSELEGREPVFAVYIDCAGRCAGYAGMEMEDAHVIQQTVAGRVPVLGLYTGVEIASMGGRPRGLDWTGVFCLFSQSRDHGENVTPKKVSRPAWDFTSSRGQSGEIPVEAMIRLNEQNAAKITALTASSVAIRHELEHKRRGFRLLAELAVSLRQNSRYESVFIPVARNINAALNMQRTIVLEKNPDGLFSPLIMHGYSPDEKADLAGIHIQIPPELLNQDKPFLLTGADESGGNSALSGQLNEFRKILGLRYLISSPVMIHGEVFAVLITGRLVEAPPFLVRLSVSDAETVQAICALLATVFAEQRLAEAEERNRLMIDAMPVSCTLWDENGNLTDCNKETLTLFGLSSKEEFIRRFFTSLIPEYQSDGRRSDIVAKERIMKAFVSGGGRFRWNHLTADGTPFPVEVTLIRIPKGDGYALAGYVYDLRDQEAALARQIEAREMAERYARARNDFLASVSHEIRTPLNAVRSMAQIAGEMKNLNENQRSVIDQGMVSMKLLTSAIDTILDFSKIDSGQMSLENETFSVRKMAEGIGEMVRPEASAKSLYLHVTVDPLIPETVLGDMARLQQALFNLVMNAVKFTEKGGVDINVRTGEDGAEGTVSLVFEVKDTGIGIGKEKMEHLFQPLYSADASYTKKQGGMGMGLAISSGLASLMGGNISCESTPGEGSVFRLFLSLAVPVDESAHSGGKSADAELLRGMRVLVAEDNLINQMIVDEMLSAAGIEVTTAEDGMVALEKLEREDFDLVLMDIQMPGMDGLTAAAQIRSNPRYGKLPILAMTANAGAEHLKESINAGMNDHLTKPIDIEKLYGALLKWGKNSA